jgi:hypothetical protein
MGSDLAETGLWAASTAGLDYAFRVGERGLDLALSAHALVRQQGIRQQELCVHPEGPTPERHGNGLLRGLERTIRFSSGQLSPCQPDQQ